MRKFDSEICEKTWGKTAKDSLFTGAPASKLLEKAAFRKYVGICESNFFNISMSRIRKMLTDMLKTRFFRLLLAWAPVNKEPLALFVQVLYTSLNPSFWLYQCLGLGKCLQMCWKGGFSGFCLLGRLWTRSLWPSLLKFCTNLWINDSQYINVSDLEDAHRCVEKELFPVFACFGACEQRAFGCLCSSFVHLSESNFLLDVVKKDFFQLFACLSACEQDAFEGFCWKVVEISHLFHHYIKTAKKLNIINNKKKIKKFWIHIDDFFTTLFENFLPKGLSVADAKNQPVQGLGTPQNRSMTPNIDFFKVWEEL